MPNQTTRAVPQRFDNLRKLFSLVFSVCLSLLLLSAPAATFADGAGPSAGDNGDQSEGGVSVMQSFNKEQNHTLDQVIAISEHEKQVIMFIMGASLLIAVITTASLGIAMVLHGKEVFLAHMVSAGISVFLAIAHAVVAVVWFFPF